MNAFFTAAAVLVVMLELNGGPSVFVSSFQAGSRPFRSPTAARFASAAAAAAAAPRGRTTTRLNVKTLGLLTFDLDDSLYPIKDVISEANAALVAAMKSFGFDGIQPSDIDRTAREIRQGLPAEENLVLSHTECRRRAIRREMEKIILERKLQETADDWATPVSDLSPIVVNFAKK